MSHPAPPPWRVQAHQNLASTQDAAIEAARAGDPGRLAILAHTQTAGRGSRGRSWAAPAGNLNLSALLRPTAPAEPGLWALIAGIALHDALAPYAQNLMLKWPNDLLREGAKLGGILIDATIGPDGTPAWLVIGIGANLASAPHIEGRATACLPPPAPSAEKIASAILTQLDQAAALKNISAEWLSRAHPAGTALDIRTPRRHIRGVFETITPAGALKILDQPDPIASAEVFLRQQDWWGEAAPPDPRHVLEAAATCCL